METNGNDLELFSRHKAAKFMKIGTGTLIKLINRGEIGVVKLGDREKIPKRELIRFLDEKTVRSNRELNNYLFTETNPNDILISREKKTSSLGGDLILTELLNELNGE